MWVQQVMGDYTKLASDTNVQNKLAFLNNQQSLHAMLIPLILVLTTQVLLAL
jgi:hypothetical protein